MERDTVQDKANELYPYVMSETSESTILALRSAFRAGAEWQQEQNSEEIDVVFDKMPSHDSATFVEVEDSTGASVRRGEWVVRPDGYVVLRLRLAL